MTTAVSATTASSSTSSTSSSSTSSNTGTITTTPESDITVTGTSSSTSEADTSASTEDGTSTTSEGTGTSSTTGDEEGSCEAENESSIVSTVFVTSDVFVGDLKTGWNNDINGGLKRADIHCQCTAQEAGLTGGYLAWLNIWGSNLNEFKTDDTPRHFIRTDGQCVALSWEELLSENHMQPINIDENVSPVKDNSTVWTGANANGSFAAPACWSWTSSQDTALGTVGAANAKGANWSNAGAKDCNTANHLYCIQVSNTPFKYNSVTCP